MPSSSIAIAEFGLFAGAQPVRAIRPRTGRQTMPGWFPTDKGTLPSLRTETILELDGLGHFEVDSNIILMAAQPHELVYHEPVGRRSSIRRSYHPDVALLMRDGEVVIVDFKVAKYARRASWVAKEAVIRAAYLRDHFARFTTVTDEALGIEPRRTNVKILLMHRRMWRDDEADAAISARIATVGLPSTVGHLLAGVRLPSDQPHADRGFAALVALALAGALRFDLSVLLGPATLVLPPSAPVQFLP